MCSHWSSALFKLFERWWENSCNWSVAIDGYQLFSDRLSRGGGRKEGSERQDHTYVSTSMRLTMIWQKVCCSWWDASKREQQWELLPFTTLKSFKKSFYHCISNKRLNWENPSTALKGVGDLVTTDMQSWGIQCLSFSSVFTGNFSQVSVVSERIQREQSVLDKDWVRVWLRQLNTSKSVWSDQIHPRMLRDSKCPWKTVLCQFLRILTTVVRNILQSSSKRPINHLWRTAG